MNNESSKATCVSFHTIKGRHETFPFKRHRQSTLKSSKKDDAWDKRCNQDKCGVASNRNDTPVTTLAIYSANSHRNFREMACVIIGILYGHKLVSHTCICKKLSLKHQC